MKNLSMTQFTDLINTLMDRFGNEANDIGDSAYINDLIHNTCDPRMPHDSYTVDEIRQAICEIAGIKQTDITDVLENEQPDTYTLTDKRRRPRS